MVTEKEKGPETILIVDDDSEIREILRILLSAVFSVLSVFKLISFPSFFMCALFTLILYCISLIFDYGCELQQEVDETL